MISKYKKELLISSALTLLPALLSLAIPALSVTRIVCLSLLAGQWLAFGITAADPNNKNRNEKPLKLVLWIMPITSLLCSGIFYTVSTGASVSVGAITCLALGLMFTAIGNYLPKCRQNHTIGIKVPWTFASEENWNATHRFGGRVWAVGGIAVMLTAFLPEGWNIAAATVGVVALSIVPIVYSYRYFRTHPTTEESCKSIQPMTSKMVKITTAASALILAFVLVVLFAGRVETDFGPDSFTVSGSFYGSQTVFYDRIDALEYREENIPGSRVFGVGSLRLELGTFRNEEFGNYTRFTYYKPESCIVVHMGEKVLVLSGKTGEETREIYRQLQTHVTLPYISEELSH